MTKYNVLQVLKETVRKIMYFYNVIFFVVFFHFQLFNKKSVFIFEKPAIWYSLFFSSNKDSMELTFLSKMM